MRTVWSNIYIERERETEKESNTSALEAGVEKMMPTRGALVIICQLPIHENVLGSESKRCFDRGKHSGRGFLKVLPLGTSKRSISFAVVNLGLGLEYSVPKARFTRFDPQLYSLISHCLPKKSSCFV